MTWEVLILMTLGKKILKKIFQVIYTEILIVLCRQFHLRLAMLRLTICTIKHAREVSGLS